MSWYRVAFTNTRVAALEFSDAVGQINDTLRHAGYPADIGVFITDDWIYPSASEEEAIVVYFPPSAVEMFSALILALGGERCAKPLPFGLMVHGNRLASSLLE